MFEHLRFLFQRISIMVQCFNSVLLHDGLVDDNWPEYGSLPNKFSNFYSIGVTIGFSLV